MTKNAKRTSEPMASMAARTLADENASAIQRRLAGSVLSQSSTGNETGAEMETVAGRVLQNPFYSDLTRSLAGSIVSQSHKKR